MEYSKIKKNTDFQKIFSKGKRGFSARLTMIYLPSDGMKMGVCVGKKNGGSVERNHVKRLLREIFRKNSELLKKNYCYVLMPRPMEEYNYHDLEKDFFHIVKKQKLLLEENKTNE